MIVMEWIARINMKKKIPHNSKNNNFLIKDVDIKMPCGFHYGYHAI